MVVLGILGSCCMAWCLCVQAAQIQKNMAADIVFPYAVPGTPLIVEGLVSYEGAFLENADREEVAEVAALLLRNTGAQGITESRVTVKQGDRLLRFYLTELPPEASLLVLEEAGQSYTREPVQCCEGTAVCGEAGWNPEEYLELREVEPGGLEIVNRKDFALRDLRLWYKPAYPEGDFYLGGLTWEILVGDLEPGGRICVYPEHYCSGVSRILRCSWEGEK